MDVINLVSSDEEDNDGGLRNKIKSNKNLTVKKIKPSRVQTNVNEIPIQKVALQNEHKQNNNTKITVISGFRKERPSPKQQPLQQKLSKLKEQQLVFSSQKSKDGKSIETKQKTLNLSTSGITITPINNSHGKVAAPTRKWTINSITPKLKTNSMTIIPKPVSLNNFQPIQLTRPANQPAKPSSVVIPKPAKRIIPTRISDKVTSRASSMEKSSDSDMMSRDSSSAANDMTVTHNGTNQPEEQEPTSKRPKVETQKRPLHDDYKQLIDACRIADPSKDMDKIVLKLEKHYQKAHSEYINSKSFHKLVTNVTTEIQSEPTLVYMKINNLLEELKTRRTMEIPTSANETPIPVEIEVDEKKTKRIQRLSDALRILQKKIRRCEETEVDFKDELNSKYLETERYKKRAVEIYEKLCDITGESRSAERSVKKPIKFQDSSYPEFNRKLEQFINKTKSFPDMFDVLRIMDHCDKVYHYRMSKEERKIVAQSAFHKVGTLLQKRRKTDLYEMVHYFTANQSDPAVEDDLLKTKLEENQRHYSKKMNDMIDKYTRHNGSHHNDSDGNQTEKSPMKSEKNQNSRPTDTKDPTTSSPLKNDPEVIITDLDADIDMLNDSVTYISDGDFNDIAQDALLIEQDEEELTKEFYPTITSVTSLHPAQFNEFMKFDQNSLESSNIL